MCILNIDVNNLQYAQFCEILEISLKDHCDVVALKVPVTK